MFVEPSRHRANLARSIRLFRLFLKEQTSPALFYSEFAEDSVAVLADKVELSGAVVLDVGGGPGYFATAFTRRGARYVGVELDGPGDLPAEASAVKGSADRLPFRTATVDVAYCSNVLEHVSQPWAVADELVRVTRPGGTIFISFTLWLSPWGGHETAPWHYFGGRRASAFYARREGHLPKNDYGITLFPHTAAAALRWAQQQSDADLVVAYPRYHPWWTWWVVRLPGVREVLTWNLAMVLRRR
jgi:SAM-dependent methyltransferase